MTTATAPTTAPATALALAGHGPNVGHGWTKYIVIDSKGRELPPVVIPSVVARAEANVAGALARTQRVKVADGSSFWVGEDAQLSPSQITMLGQDRLTDPHFIPALLRGALGRFPHLNGAAAGVCVSGLPATWSLDVELAGQLGQRIRDAVGPNVFPKIKVIAEPLGLLYSVLLDNNGATVGDQALALNRVGIVDLGHLSVDLAEILKLQPIRSSLDTFTLGSSVPLGQIRAHFSAHFNRDFSLLETDLAIRAGKARVGGKDKLLPRHWDAPYIENGKTITARLEDRWGSGAQFEAILLGGGEAEVEQVTAPVCKKFANAIVVPDAQLAVARGYARLARRVAAALR